MIKFIANTIAKDFVEKNINDKKDSNLVSNLAYNSMSVMSMFSSLWKYILIIGILLLTFVFGIPILVSYLGANIGLIILSVIISIILSGIFVVKLIKNISSEIVEEMSKTLALTDNVFNSFKDIIGDSNESFQSPVNTEELNGILDETFRHIK